MEALFFTFLFFVAYPYFLFPMIMALLIRVKTSSWERNKYSPCISIIISVYNEEQVIREKIENSLTLEYPEDLLEILVVSDGSTDRTHEIVQSFSDPRVVLQIYSERAGKTECLNQAVPGARGEIILFTDANSMFPADTLLNLSRNFIDEQIGLVTGWTKYRTAEGGEETTGLYAKLEKITKQGESLVSSCVGADGAIFAIRKELYRPLEVYDINDFVIPLNVIAQKKRVVLDPEVFCYEEPSEGEGKEFKRQVRITNRTLGAIWRGRGFLNPAQYGTFSLFLLSHKVLKFLVPFFFVGSLLCGLLLFANYWVYAALFLVQLVFIGLGVAGIYRSLDGRLVNLCAFFLLTITAQSVGWFRFLTGRSDTLWTPQR